MKFCSTVFALLFLVSCASNQVLVDVDHLQKDSIEKVSRLPASFNDVAKLETAPTSLTANELRFIKNDLFLKASNAKFHSDYRTADVYWKKLMIIDGNDPMIKRQYAANLVAIGDLKNAKVVLQEIYESTHYKDLDVALVLAGVNQQLSLQSEANDIFYQVLRNYPGNQDACINLSTQMIAKKQFSKAHKFLAKCEKQDKNPAFSFLRGKIEVELKHVDKAISFLKKSIAIDPKYEQAVMSLGLLYETERKNELAKNTYNGYMNKYGDTYGMLSRLIYIYNLEGNQEKVTSAMERLSTLDPSDINLKVRLGVAYTDQNRFDDAISIFQEILTDAPKSDKVLFYLSALLIQKNRENEALVYLARIPRDSSLYAESRMQMARVLSLAARDDFKEFNDRGEKEFMAFYDAMMNDELINKAELKSVLAAYYDDIGKTHNAISILEAQNDLLALDSDNAYYLASLYDKVGKKEKSVEVLRRVVDEDSENPDLLNFLGYVLLELNRNEKDLEEAYTYISKAVQLKPEDGYIRDSLGYYYFLKKDYSRAKQELTVAWNLVDDYTIAKHLAEVCNEVGDFAKAKYFYQQAIAQCKEEKEKAKLQQRLTEIGLERLPASK